MKKIALPYFLAFLAVLVLSFLAFTLAYSQKIYPNIEVAGENLSGLTKKEALEKLEKKKENLNLVEITFVSPGKTYKIRPEEIDFDFQLEKTASFVFSFGRKKELLISLKEQVSSLFKKRRFLVFLSFDEEKLEKKFEKMAKEIDIPEQTVSFVLEEGKIKKLPKKDGQRLKIGESKKAFFDSLGNFQDKVELVVEKISPFIEGREEEVEKARKKFENLVSDSLVLSWKKEKLILKPEELQGWVKFYERPGFPLYLLDLKPDEEKIEDYLKSLAKKINKEAVDAKLTISDGRATIFRPEEDGYKLEEKETKKEIMENLNERMERGFIKEVTLKVSEIKPKVRAETINNLGIKELIGEGSSYFKGSPQNRIHNIQLGASLFNGVLIPPEGIFSFNEILGEASEKKGFLPELVIKEDRLIPETGGGLCQVSTTMFRAAIYSGLDILERTPHSFRVRYYEPPVGLDATVYNPKPDLKFKNDTEGYILIQTKIEGFKLTFQFYGTKDGREVEIKGPYTAGYKAPGEPVYIDDPGMPAGEIKQIERAVPGLTATIYWTVYKDGKTLHQKTFVSKYVPWPAKYKRGTGPPPAEQQPSQ